MEIIESIALISINETLIAQVVSFLIFLFVIDRIMFRPLRSAIGDRDAYMENMQAEIAGAEAELKQAAESLKNEERAAKSEALSAQQAIEAEGTREAEQIIASAREEMVQLRRENQKEIDAQITQAREDVQRESESLAVAIMEKVLDRRVA